MKCMIQWLSNKYINDIQKSELYNKISQLGVKCICVYINIVKFDMNQYHYLSFKYKL